MSVYHNKANWLAADLQDPKEWVLPLGAREIDDLDTALASAKAQGLTIDRLTRENFPVASFGRLVPEIQDRLENGRGIVVLRGLPALRYTKADLRLLYWGMGLHLGTAVSQSSKGDLLGDVRDFGQDFKTKTGRGYMSRQGLGFHTDTADVVSLMVLRVAKNGGRSMICSSLAIRNEIAARRPDLLAELYRPYWWSWKGQEAAGASPYYQQPVYSEFNGKFCSRHNWPHIYAAHEHYPELPALTDKQKEALKLIDEFAENPKYHFSMLFEPGDIQLLNNHVTYHGRTEFEDWPEEDRKRHLLRMWLSMPNTRDLSPLMSAVYQDRPGGSVRGGFPSRTGGHSFETVPADQH